MRPRSTRRVAAPNPPINHLPACAITLGYNACTCAALTTPDPAERDGGLG